MSFREEQAALLADAVDVEASCRAKELDVRVPPRARVVFDGEGRSETRRVGIPPTGTQAGEEYRDVSVTVTIRGRLRMRR